MVAMYEIYRITKSGGHGDTNAINTQCCEFDINAMIYKQLNSNV